jgi:hypothetical protein
VIRLNLAISANLRLFCNLKSVNRLHKRTHYEISLQSKWSDVTPWTFYCIPINTPHPGCRVHCSNKLEGTISYTTHYYVLNTEGEVCSHSSIRRASDKKGSLVVSSGEANFLCDNLLGTFSLTGICLRYQVSLCIGHLRRNWKKISREVCWSDQPPWYEQNV